MADPLKLPDQLPPRLWSRVLPKAEGVTDGTILISHENSGNSFRVSAPLNSDVESTLYGHLVSKGESSNVFEAEFQPIVPGGTTPPASVIKVAIKWLKSHQPEDAMRD
jgi:hypothetical protein